MNKETLQKRDSSPDLIRIFAGFFVVCVHSFLRSGFYEIDTAATLPNFLLICLRSFFMICVPLFMMLSGYLMRKKTLSKSYYKKLIPTLLIYFFAVLVNLLYNLYLGKELRFSDIFFWFFGFKTHYSWYVEMYIGLFLLIPFLNLVYNTLKSKKQKQVLLLTLLLLTALPTLLNIWDFRTPGALLTPSVSTSYQKLFPDWWLRLYPLSYYFIGCYLSEFKITVKKRYLVLLLILQTFIAGGFNFYRSLGVPFLKKGWSDFYSLLTVVTAVLFFLLITNIRTENWNVKVKATIKYFSSLPLCTYLVSYVFEHYFYTKLNALIPVVENRFVYLPLMILIVFFSATALSAVINLLCKGILKLPSLIKNRSKIS